ncbi:MAG: hypothetical protein II847_09620 [Ruminobacter sp.]|uniref:hypothetical protein n=1 Tax=Ruminobacter sp. TaxID=2774296 RepID=UPI00257E768B|nr:hypothetical protein [Ruminobacter sp.]MBQ3776362.1 hypothetical protein [Ruminobacter sp.]
MARKKIVFVIVEGPSDDEALGVMLEKVFSSSSVYVHITHGDITSKPGTNPSKIRTIVCDIVKKYANSNYLKKLIFSRLFI